MARAAQAAAAGVILIPSRREKNRLPEVRYSFAMARRRQSIGWAVALAALFILARHGVREGWFKPAPREGFRVVERVIDGDTLELEGGERVRLIGVDTPELHHPEKPVEYFAREAAAFTERLCEGKPVRLEYDRETEDRYGRTLAYVYLEDGTFVNAEIIRQGFGFAYTRFPFAYLEEFRALERAARENQRGLWADTR